MSEYKIGTVKATALVAGNMIGSGVLLAPAILAPYGSMAIIGWILTTIGALALALVFAKLCNWIPKAGGPYSFVKHVFGDFIGFQMAWGYWISTWCGSVSLVVGTLAYLSIFWPDLASNQTFCMCFGVAMIWFFTFINMKSIKESTFVGVIIAIVKIVPIVLVAVCGIFYVDFSTIINVADIEKHGISSLGLMAQTLLWAFIGLESATVPSDQVDNPKKTIPIATIAGVLLTAFVYIFCAIAIVGLVPNAELITSQAPYVDAAKKMFGEYGALFMSITGIIAIAGSLNGWILIQGHVPYAAAQEGLFPACFGKVNKNGAPKGVVIGSVLITFVFLLSYRAELVNQIKILIEVSVLAMLLPYFYSVVSYIYLAVTKKSEFSTFEKVSSCLVGFIAFSYSFLAIVGSGKDLICIGFLMFLVSVPFYCFVLKGKEKQTN